MTNLKIKRIEVQGFRAFGKAAQALDFDSLIACAWGPNSQGKTSLAEAFEFLLTGQIVRRELLASAQDEFADALRNAHMPHGTPTFVSAIVTVGGTDRTIKRTLTADYGKKQDCQSALEIDGKPAKETDLAALGVVLSQPPLRAPVLAQHTLGYLFSAKPQDRANYFKALLEVTDLEELRTGVAAQSDALKVLPLPLLEKLTAAIAIPAAKAALQPLTGKVPSLAVITAAVDAALDAVIAGEGEVPPATTAERIPLVEELLTRRRARTFPIRDFDRAPLPALTLDPAAHLEALRIYLAERAKVEAETRRLSALFAEALAVPLIADARDPIDCPLCGAEATLTPARIEFIRRKLRDTEAFRDAEKAAETALSQLAATVNTARKQAAAALPRFLVQWGKDRRKSGFRLSKVAALLGDDNASIIAAWSAATRALVRHWRQAERRAIALSQPLEAYRKNLDSLDDLASVQAQCEAAGEAIVAYGRTLSAYAQAEKPVLDALKTVIDSQSDAGGWAELIEIAKDPAGLRRDLVQGASVQQLQRELTQALRQIDAGNEKVLEQKFAALSSEIAAWWNLLRPDELSFFSGVRPRPGARRTIDFKAGLSVSEDRSNPTLRDVIAVFSQSQLHCLGLALFIARAVHEKVGFIVLDDPILSSDEDYRAHFNSAVLEKLIDADMQVILLTQDQKTCKDLTERYLHRKIGTFQINLNSPADGTTVVNKADDLSTKLSQAEVYIRGGHPDLHKHGGEILRDAAERFCKEVLVKDRRAQGDKKAAISDYDGKNLGELSPKTETLMKADPSHPGKLRAIGSNLNPANHDDAIPGPGVLRVALGDLRTLKKTYLR